MSSWTWKQRYRALLSLGDLNTEVLDLFGPNNFPDVKDYEVIAPSLRPASLLLQHSSLWSTPRTMA